jgi:hypothetical protein
MEIEMSKVSLTSRILDVLGRTLIGAPRRLGLGDEFEDFYYMPSERRIDAVEHPRKKLTVNTLRILIFKRVAVIASVMSFAVCLLGVITLVSLRGIASVAHASAMAVALQSSDCASLRERYGNIPLTPEQLKAFHARCDGQ